MQERRGPPGPVVACARLDGAGSLARAGLGLRFGDTSSGSEGPAKLRLALFLLFSAPMSWNLFIYKVDPNADPDTDPAEEETLPLGSPGEVAAALNAAFPGLRWPKEEECELPADNGFIIELNIEDGVVSDLYTHGGYDHLRQLAGLCIQHGWCMADAQEGEDIDLHDPYATYGDAGAED